MNLEKMYVEDVPDGDVCYLQQYDHPDDWGIKVGDVFLTNNRWVYGRLLTDYATHPMKNI